MNPLTAMDTFDVFGLAEWRDRQAVAQAQAEIEDLARTILWAIVTAFASVILGSLIFAVLS